MPTKRQVLRPVRANCGIEVAYRRRLFAMIEEMHADVVREITATWDDNTPHMARDEIGVSPARALIATMRKLGRIWRRRLDDLAPELAAHFAKEASARSDAAFMAALRKAGFTVRFRMTRRVHDIVQATIGENVNLIQSLPEQYLTQVEGEVMRAVQVGGDLGGLVKAIMAQTGVTRRRAEIIARDQNSKATSAIVRARQQEAGITQAIWKHSHGGRHPRPEHVKADGKPYDVEKGMFLDGVWTWPGREINCRCFSVPIMPWEKAKAPD